MADSIDMQVFDDVKQLLAVADQGIMGAITGRAIYEGALDLAEAQELCDRGYA